MTLTLRIGVTALLSCAVLLFAQDSTRSADQKLGPPATPKGKSAQAQPTTQGPIDILTDTRGVDFGPYLARVLHDVRTQWYRVIPDSARKPIMKKGMVLVGFRIAKDGAMGDLHLVQSSGDSALDEAASEGVASSAPFSPLPNEFHCQYIALQFHFYYNPAIGDLDQTEKSLASRQLLPCVTTAIEVKGEVAITVSPASAEVARGATQQFSVTKYGAASSAVNWSISGPDCTGSDCGSISGDGVYTAPTNIPDPPRVKVTATLADDTGKTDSATVAIIRLTSPNWPVVA